MLNLKVLLCDARHSTVGAHSNYVPINIGYIGSYIKEEIKNVDMELILSVDPDEIFTLLRLEARCCGMFKLYMECECFECYMRRSKKN